MLLTMKEALQRVDEQDMHHIYLYSEGDTVFYVGRSIHPFERLQEHIGNGSRNAWPDGIGQFIIDNQPISLTWIVEVRSIQELAPDRYAQLVAEGASSYAYRSLAEEIETNLMKICKPCLNSTGRQGRTPLPEQYRRITNQGVVITEEGE